MTLTTQSEVSLASSHEEVSFLLAQTTEETETEEDDILTSTPTPIPTRSYIGIGGNIGLSGDSTPFGDSGFSLLGRTAITDNISLHTSSVFRDDGVSAFALTFGVPISQSGRDLELVYPFVGSGIAVEDLFGDFEVNALVTTGVDVPILRRLTGTVRLNFDFAEDDTNIGLLIGVGYNFSIFELF
ncbi:MAG: hypothetical protein AAF652_16515 [Cyanobacteria bacterium P01_C01_bin.72]